MAEEKEILRYELDLTDVEAKAARMQQLLADIRTKRAAGEDTGALEAQFARESEGLAKAAKEHKELNESTQQFAHGGARSMLGILSVINPELGAMGNLALRAFEVFKHAGPSLLGLAGVAAALAAIVEELKSYTAELERNRAAAERAAEAGQRLREGGVGARARLEKAGAAVGITGAGPRLQEMARKIQAEQGGPADIAENAAVAEEFATQHMMAFNRQDWLAGIVAGGAKPMVFGSTGDTKKAIAKALARGQAPEARQALGRFLSVVGPQAKAEAPSETAETEDALDRGMARLKRDRPDLTDEELGTIQHEARYWRMGRPKHPAVDMETRGVLKTGWWRALGKAFQPDFVSEATIQGKPSELGGGATSVGGLIQLIQAVSDQAGAHPEGHPAARSGWPTTIYVQNNGTQYNRETKHGKRFGVQFGDSRSRDIKPPDGG